MRNAVNNGVGNRAGTLALSPMAIMRRRNGQGLDCSVKAQKGTLDHLKSAQANRKTEGRKHGAKNHRATLGAD
jgi:hypothetical protein